MLETIRLLIAQQYEGSLCMLRFCIDLCPESHWHEPVANNPFSQSAFHTLFFTDFYLEPNDQSIRDQDFHKANAEFFGDYEQLQPMKPESIYERDDINRYLRFCRKKAIDVVAAETEESLSGPSGFERRRCSRAELHVYNMRHIQHHAAQLSLRLRLDHGIDVPWVGHEWRDA